MNKWTKKFTRELKNKDRRKSNAVIFREFPLTAARRELG